MYNVKKRTRDEYGLLWKSLFLEVGDTSKSDGIISSEK
jgi:hypothetical protein